MASFLNGIWIAFAVEFSILSFNEGNQYSESPSGLSIDLKSG